MIGYLTAVLYGNYSPALADVKAVRRFIDGKPSTDFNASAQDTEFLLTLREIEPATVRQLLEEIGGTQQGIAKRLARLLAVGSVRRIPEGKTYLYEVSNG